MTALLPGAIDCDLHPAPPSVSALLPYLEPHWADAAGHRGLHELETIAWPPNAPLSCRPDWRDGAARPGSDPARLISDAVDGFGTRFAILNCLYGAPMLYSEDMAAGFCRALNDWLKAEWLDRDPRLRASILVPPHAPDLAAEEIERAGADRRFVQVLLPVMGETPPGRRTNWPIYAAAERAGLPVAFHAGSAYRHPPTPVGWPSYLAEDYAAQATAFQSALTSLIAEGVFQKFPELTVVFAESGVAWLPAHLWRLTKYWRGLRMEIPWVDRSPEEIVRERIRFTIQPFDAPADPEAVARLLDHLGSDDMLLFATDYPHWQFDGMGALPEGLPEALVRRIAVDNPRATYLRLREGEP